MIKEIRWNKEDQVKEKIGFQRYLEKFHKWVTQEIEKYEKWYKEVVEKIQIAIENISFPPLESSRFPEINYEPSIFKRLFEEKPSVGTQTKLKMCDTIHLLLNAELDKKNLLNRAV